MSAPSQSSAPLHEPPEFAPFYKETAPRLMSMLQVLGAGPEDAAECVQETMIKAYNRWNDIENHRAWCRTTATHTYYRLCRGRRDEHLSSDVTRLGGTLVGASPT